VGDTLDIKMFLDSKWIYEEEHKYDKNAALLYVRPNE